MRETPEEDFLRREKLALSTKKIQETMDRMDSPDTLSPEEQSRRTKRLAKADKELAEVKRFRDRAQERISVPLAKNPSVSVPLAENPSVPVPLIGNPPAQRVLTETFRVNRLKEIRQLVGDSKLKDFTKGYEREVREEEISRIFKRFLCENVDGDIPYFCV